jgi:hypothetical protein
METNNSLPLKIIFIAYIISAVFSINSGSSNFVFYISTVIGSSLILLILLVFHLDSKFYINESEIFMMLLVSLLILVGLIHSADILGVFLFLIFCSLIIYFKIQKTSIIDIVAFANWSFLIYFSLSLISYFGIAFQHSKDVLNSFDINYGFISFETLYGLEGSTADIDSYSSVIVLLNLFLNKRKSKYIFILMALIALIWTARFTPIVSFIFSVITFIFIRNKWSALIAISMIFVGFISFTYIEMYHPYDRYFSSLVPNKLVLQLATHGRTYIWSEQMKNISENFHLLDYLLGNYKFSEVSIPWSDGTTSNSHNSFLALYFRMGIVVLLMLAILIHKIFSSFNRLTFPILFSIFLSATTNGTIFYVGNPIFLILTIYLTYFYESYQND